MTKTLMFQSIINNKFNSWLAVKKDNAIIEFLQILIGECVSNVDKILRINAFLNGEVVGTNLGYYKIV